MEKVKSVEKALVMIENRLNEFPDFEIYQSISRQLTYLLNVLNGVETDTSKVDKIIVGLYAVREFEESDPELSNILIDCQNIVNGINL